MIFNCIKVLFVTGGNLSELYKNDYSSKKKISFYIQEQADALKQLDIEIDFFLLKTKGISGYFKRIFDFNKFLKNKNYDIIHAHYGLSGLVACSQRKIPVITTFHGSDINNPKINIFSSLASLFSAYRIFVSKSLYSKIFIQPKKNYEIIPCGINIDSFCPIEKEDAREKLKLEMNKKYILFSSSFSNPIKNYPLAKSAIEKLSNKVELIELKEKSREEINLLLNACDLLLVTSRSEGSPQVIKEALACNTPIVSTDVGDVKEQIQNVKACYLTSYNPEEIAKTIEYALRNKPRSNGNQLALSFSNKIIASKIKEIYKKILGG